MATATIRPVVLVSQVFNQSSADSIDDPIIDPAAGDGLTVQANDQDGNEDQGYNLDNPSDNYTDLDSAQVITALTAKTLCQRDLSPGPTTINLKVNGSLQVEQTLTLEASDTWQTHTFNGSWTIAQLDAMQVWFGTADMPKNSIMFIEANYVQFSYSPVVVVVSLDTGFTRTPTTDSSVHRTPETEISLTRPADTDAGFTRP